MTSTGLGTIQMSCLLGGGFKGLQSSISWNTEYTEDLKFRWTQTDSASKLVQSTNSMEHLQKTPRFFQHLGPQILAQAVDGQKP